MPGGLGIRRAALVVGRETELDILLRAVRGAGGPRGACIFLVGEGGVGKTRLADRDRGRRRASSGSRCRRARAPITTPVAFSLIAEALRSWLRGHPSAATEQPVRPRASAGAARSGIRNRPKPTELSAAQLRLLALEGIVHLVRDIAATNGGVVVLLDDVHAADPESLEAIRYLAAARDRRLRPRRRAALGRGDAAPTSSYARSITTASRKSSTWSRSSARAVSELVAALLDADPPEALVADIVARTDGIPLLSKRCSTRTCAPGSVEVGADGTVWRGGTTAVPKTIRGMVEARLDRLTPPQRDVLVAGAVVGDFDLGSGRGGRRRRPRGRHRRGDWRRSRSGCWRRRAARSGSATR